MAAQTTETTPARFFIDITSQTIEITAEEVWPAGDGPDDPTAEDVARELRGSGSRSAVLNEWGVDAELRVVISEPGKAAAAEVWV